MNALSVVIPAYNEEQGIAATLERLKRVAVPLEVIVVDDGSTDRTGDIARKFGARVIRHPANGGYGLSLKSGIRSAAHDLIAITDADGTYPVEQLPLLMKKVEEGFDMAVGARHGKEYWGTFLKMPARLIFQFLVEFSTGQHIPDVNSGLRVFRKRDVEPLFPHLCDTFSFTTTLTLAYCFLHKFICYLPITYERRIGRSKIRIVRDSFRTLQFIVESITHFNPLKLFLLIALFLILLAGGFLAASWSLAETWLSLSALLCFLASLLTFTLGILAEILHKRT